MNLEDGEEKALAQILQAGDEIWGGGSSPGRSMKTSSAAMARTADRKTLKSAPAHSGLGEQVRPEGRRTSSSIRSFLPISTGIEEEPPQRAGDDRRARGESPSSSPSATHRRRPLQRLVRAEGRRRGLVLNSAFLHELREAGLTAGDCARPRKFFLPQNRIPAEQWNAALDLIYDRPGAKGFDPLTYFISRSSLKAVESCQGRGDGKICRSRKKLQAAHHRWRKKRDPDRATSTRRARHNAPPGDHQ